MNQAIKLLEEKKEEIKEKANEMTMEESMELYQEISQYEKAISILDSYSPSCSSIDPDGCLSCGS